jgi:hypothetical protein
MTALGRTRLADSGASLPASFIVRRLSVVVAEHVAAEWRQVPAAVPPFIGLVRLFTERSQGNGAYHSD